MKCLGRSVLGMMRTSIDCARTCFDKESSELARNVYDTIVSSYISGDAQVV